MNRRARILTLGSIVASAVAFPAGAALAATDSEIAAQGVIVSTDMPADWTATPRDTSGEAEGLKVARKIAACKGYVAFETANNSAVSADSDDFTTASDQIHNSSHVYPSDAAAKRVMRSLGPPKTVASCLTAMLRKALDTQFGSDKTVKRMRALVKPVTETVSTPDAEGVGFGGGFQITLKDGSTEARSVALVATRVGRVINTYSADSDPSAGDISSAFQQAVEATVNRSIAAQQ